MSASAETTEAERLATETILVGVDGSEGSLEALDWAAQEARLRGARLHVVLAWEAPWQMLGLAFAIPGHDELAYHGRLARERLDAVLDSHAAELSGLEVERSAVHGSAAAVLLEAASDAAALVLGTRGRGGFGGLLLGSVGRQCAHHAPCPVVIVPQAR